MIVRLQYRNPLSYGFGSTLDPVPAVTVPDILSGLGIILGLIGNGRIPELCQLLPQLLGFSPGLLAPDHRS